MKRVAAVALAVLVALAVPGFAQRGGGGGHGGGGGGFYGGGGGFSGHGGGFSGGFRGGFSAPRSSGGFSAPRSYGFNGGARYARPSSAYRPYSAYRSSRYGSGFHAPYNRGGYYNHGGYRSRYRDDRFRRSYFNGVFLYPNWIGLGTLGCYDDSYIYNGDDFGGYGPDCYQPQPAQADQPVIYGDDQGGTPAPPPDYAPPAYQPPAYEPPPAQTPHSTQVPTSQIATTIVFKDGRPPEQIHNYALTQTNLYVMDQQRRDIPLDQIDVAATEKANRAAGIEFQVPQSVQ